MVEETPTKWIIKSEWELLHKPKSKFTTRLGKKDRKMMSKREHEERAMRRKYEKETIPGRKGLTGPKQKTVVRKAEILRYTRKDGLLCWEPVGYHKDWRWVYVFKVVKPSQFDVKGLNKYVLYDTRTNLIIAMVDVMGLRPPKELHDKIIYFKWNPPDHLIDCTPQDLSYLNAEQQRLINDCRRKGWRWSRPDGKCIEPKQDIAWDDDEDDDIQELSSIEKVARAITRNW